MSVFFKFMVLPLFNLWHKFLDTKLSHSMMENLRKNQQQWEELREREKVEDPLADASPDGPTIVAEDDMTADAVSDGMQQGRRGSLPAVVLETVDKMGRRHSVPLNLARVTAQVPCTLLRRESLGSAACTLVVQADNRRRFTLGQIPYLEEEEEGLSISLGSSRSSGLQRSSDGGGGGGSYKDDRPVSAENLIPEPSIATITNPVEATRLCNVIHGVTSPVLQQMTGRGLTRQQTFPPIQPYVRARYLSTGGTSNEQTTPGSSSSGGGGGSTSAASTASSRTGSTSSDCCCGGGGGANGTKRDSILDTDRAFKLARFSKEKENVDPASRTTAEIRRNSNHVNQVMKKKKKKNLV